MKRVTILTVVFILVFSLSVLNLEAENKKNHMFLNFGTMGGFGIGLWTAGINVDFQLEDSLTLTPNL